MTARRMNTFPRSVRAPADFREFAFPLGAFQSLYSAMPDQAFLARLLAVVLDSDHEDKTAIAAA